MEYGAEFKYQQEYEFDVVEDVPRQHPDEHFECIKATLRDAISRQRSTHPQTQPDTITRTPTMKLAFAILAAICLASHCAGLPAIETAAVGESSRARSPGMFELELMEF